MATCCNHSDAVEKKFKNTEFTFITHVWACDHDSTEWNLEVSLICLEDYTAIFICF